MTITENDKGAATALDLVADRAKNMAPILDSIGRVMLDSIGKNFQQEGRPQKWAAWSPKYAEWRKGISAAKTVRRKQAAGKTGHGTDMKILSLNKHLKGSITAHTQGNVLHIGTNVEYAAAHQYGWPARHIPARPFLLFQESDITRIRQIFADSFEHTNVVRGTGV